MRSAHGCEVLLSVMSSKYDVVKLKVRLSSAHYYILSRFLLSKMLMFCCIPEDAAVRISLEVKKHFVNNEHTTITQEELENYLQSVIAAFGGSAAHTRLFPVVTQFQTERIPLALLLAGPACRGKTTLAHLLSAGLNCSAIINTEVLYDMTASIDGLLARLDSKNKDLNELSEGAATSSADAEVVAAVNAELDKAVSEEKVVIIEGERLRLSCFRRFLDPCFQKSAGAVIVGILLDSLDRSAEKVCTEYGENAAHLQPVYTTECVSVMSATVVPCSESSYPTLYVSRCHSVDDSLELSAFLHNVIVQRIIDELRRRGKLPACVAETADDAAHLDEQTV